MCIKNIKVCHVSNHGLIQCVPIHFYISAPYCIVFLFSRLFKETPLLICATFLVEYRNDRYKNTQFGKQNWGDATLDQSTGEMKVDPGVEYELNLIYPRYEYATGYTNNFCTRKIKIV